MWSSSKSSKHNYCTVKIWLILLQSYFHVVIFHFNSVVTQSADFNPATGICRVCLEEKFFIMFCPEGATLNQRSEFFTHCRHFHKFLLSPPPPKETTQNRKRKAPRRWKFTTNLQHIYTYLFPFNIRIVSKTFSFWYSSH